MRNARIALLLAWAVMGCAAVDGGFLSNLKDRLFGKKESSSAPGSPATPAAPAKQSEVVPAGTTDASTQPIGEIAESIVARVNGEVILGQDVFNPIRAQLAKAQQEMPPAQFPQYRNNLIQKQLRDLIERQLLVQQAKKTFPEPLIQRLQGMADKEFGKRIESEMKRMEVNTESELRRKMLENGESLDQIRDFHRDTYIAQQYLRHQLQARLEVSREEMVDYYNLHRERYAKEGGVVWDELFVSFEKYGSSAAARMKALELIGRLRGGADFAELARAESEGATASEGGRWELTTRGSFLVAAVDAALFSLPVKQISDPIEGPKGWHIVRVVENRAGSATSFADSQEEIRKAIREQKIAKESQLYVQDLLKKAHITTVFDRPER